MTVEDPGRSFRGDGLSLPLACPTCRQSLVIADAQAACPCCRETFACESQIWRLLRPGREKSLAQWIREYECVRRHEERDYHDDPKEYLALPFALPTNPRAAEWAVRGRSYRLLMDRVIGRQPLRVLDLGAGNGWLSYRLAQAGHEPWALDLTINDFDGLGAARHYQSVPGGLFPCGQAEFDALPFLDRTFDLIVFSASFHYSTDYLTTLREGLRVLRPSGTLVIMDSPVYGDGQSGRQMLVECHARFERLYGFRSDSVASRGYLTHEGMSLLSRRLGVRWTHVVPWYGWRWALKPWVARLTGQREPAQFGIWIGRRK